MSFPLRESSNEADWVMTGLKTGIDRPKVQRIGPINGTRRRLRDSKGS